MPQSYSGWSLDKLKKERLKIDKAIDMAEKRDKKATLAKIAVIAKQNGFSLHELLGESAESGRKSGKPRSEQKAVKPRGKVPPKYVNPEDQTQTWTGRGRQPLWVKEQLGKGIGIEALQIDNAPH